MLKINYRLAEFFILIVSLIWTISFVSAFTWPLNFSSFMFFYKFVFPIGSIIIFILAIIISIKNKSEICLQLATAICVVIGFSYSFIQVLQNNTFLAIIILITIVIITTLATMISKQIRFFSNL